LPIQGVEIVQAFSAGKPSSVWGIVDVVEKDRPDWIVLQYNPFSYGRRGLNLQLPRVMAHIKRRMPDVGFALMVHEAFVPIKGVRFAVMTTWQRLQFWSLCAAADVILFSIEPWAKSFRPWLWGKCVAHLPVGSNVPRVSANSGEVRASLGLSQDQLVLGLFGSAHISRMPNRIRAGLETALDCEANAKLLYVGPDVAEIGACLSGLPVICTGAVPPERVSQCLSAMDICLSPFIDGVSTRRGSFMAAIQHGVATVATDGIHTDAILKSGNGSAWLLAAVNDEAAYCAHVRRLCAHRQFREAIGSAGQTLYAERFSWPRIESDLRIALSLDGNPASAKIT